MPPTSAAIASPAGPDRGRAVHRQRLRGAVGTRSSPGMWGYVVMAVLVLIRHRHGTRRRPNPNSPPAGSRDADRDGRHARAQCRDRRFSEFSDPARCLGGVRFRGAFKFTDEFSGTMTRAVRDRPRDFRATTTAAIVKGVGLAATLIGGFAGGFVARRYRGGEVCGSAGVLHRSVICRSPGWRWSGVHQWALAFAITARISHSAIGTVILSPISGAVPQSAAPPATIRAADGARGRRADLSCLSAGYVAKGREGRWFFVICMLVANTKAWSCWPGCSGAGILAALGP